jgi:hypothetical protein
VQIQVAGFDLLEVIDQQLHAMGVYAAQIGRHQRLRDEPRFVRRGAMRQEDALAENCQFFGGNDDLRHELPA